MKRSENGFTLIEIIVTLTILAILAAALIPSMSKYFDKTYKATCQSHMGVILRSYQAVKLEHYGSVTDAASTWPSFFAEAVESSFGDKSSSTPPSYSSICPKHGTYTATFAQDGTITLKCDIHGTLSLKSPIFIAQSIHKNILKLIEDKVISSSAGWSSIDSGATNGNYTPLVNKYLIEIGYTMGDLDNYIWYYTRKSKTLYFAYKSDITTDANGVKNVKCVKVTSGSDVTSETTATVSKHPDKKNNYDVLYPIGGRE